MARFALLELSSFFFKLSQSEPVVRCHSRWFKKDDVLNFRTLAKRRASIHQTLHDFRERERTRPSRSGCNAPEAASAWDKSEHQPCPRRSNPHRSRSIQLDSPKAVRRDRRVSLRSRASQPRSTARAEAFRQRRSEPNGRRFCSSTCRAACVCERLHERRQPALPACQMSRRVGAARLHFDVERSTRHYAFTPFRKMSRTSSAMGANL